MGNRMTQEMFILHNLNSWWMDTRIIYVVQALGHVEDSMDCSAPGFPVFVLPFPVLSHRVCSNSCPVSHWCHPTILSSVTPFSSCLQYFPASRSFPMSQLFASGGQIYWTISFSISPSSECSGLISFSIWQMSSPCCPRDSQESFLAPQVERINS